MKIMIRYARGSAASYISHLDMQRAFARAIRRANVAAEYSQGFHPHIIMSFASPLSVGYATEADYVEVGVKEGSDPEQIGRRLNEVLPPDIRVTGVFSMGDINQKLMSLNHSADYSVTFAVENEDECGKIRKAAEKISRSESYSTVDRKGRTVDIVPLIRRISFEGDTLQVTLLNSSSQALNPAVVAAAVQQEAKSAAPYTVCRLECYALLSGTVVPFSALAQK